MGTKVLSNPDASRWKVSCKRARRRRPVGRISSNEPRPNEKKVVRRHGFGFGCVLFQILAQDELIAELESMRQEIEKSVGHVSNLEVEMGVLHEASLADKKYVSLSLLSFRPVSAAGVSYPGLRLDR